MNKIPLCVDLDGTLIYNDTIRLATILFIKQNPLHLILVGWWLLRGLAYMKQQLAHRIDIDVRSLPYNQTLLAWIKAEKALGRKIVLVSATDKKYATAAAAYVGIFDEVLASDGKTNLRMGNKAAALDQRYGYKNYDYAGNSSHDLPVWRHSRYAIVVNASASVVRRAQKIGNVEKVF